MCLFLIIVSYQVPFVGWTTYFETLSWLMASQRHCFCLDQLFESCDTSTCPQLTLLEVLSYGYGPKTA